MRTLFGTVTLLAMLCASLTLPASAHRRDFPVTYDWAQPQRGALEVESQTSYRTSDRSIDQQIEVEYGISDRWMVAPYVTFEKDQSGGFRYTGYRLESRYQLTPYRANSILTGIYAEAEKTVGQPGEGEGKLVFSRYGEDGSDLSLNLVTEKTIEHSDRLRMAYTMGYARDIGRSGERIGAELYKSIDNGNTNMGPTYAFSAAQNTWVVAGIGFPTNHNGSNGTDFRLLAEYEW